MCTSRLSQSISSEIWNKIRAIVLSSTIESITYSSFKKRASVFITCRRKTSTSLYSNTFGITTQITLTMVLEQYVGPLQGPLLSIANALSATLSSVGLNSPPPSQIVDALIITLFIILISSIGASLFPALTQRNNRNVMLLLGISGDGDEPAVGKTVLFKFLKNGRQPEHGTTPSMQPNDDVFTVSSSDNLSTRWVDFPGHPRLRTKLGEYLDKAQGIVFVIDGSRFSAQARRDAELLFQVMTNKTVSKYSTPVLILANKSDITPPSINPASIRTRLEAELDRLRTSFAGTPRAAIVGSKDVDVDDEDDQVMLGYDNEPFSFDHVPNDVSFAQASASTGEVSAVISFMKSCTS